MATREQVMAYLRDLPADWMLSGQMVGFGFYDLENEYQHNIEGLANDTGQYPAIIGANYGLLMDDEQHHAGNQVLIDYWQRGGLVQIDWAADNPWTGGNYKDTTRTALAHLLDPGQPVNITWDRMVERVAGFLAELQDAGVVVLWRWIPASVQYPGPDQADIAGFNWYDDTYTTPNQPAWDDLLSFSPMPALTEAGSIWQRDGKWDATVLLNALGAAPVRYFLVWDSWTNNLVALADVQNAAQLLNDQRVVNRGELEIGGDPVITENLEAVAHTLEAEASVLEALEHGPRAQVLRDQAGVIRAQCAELDALDDQLDALPDALRRDKGIIRSKVCQVQQP